MRRKSSEQFQPSATLARSRSRKKRFLIVSIPALGVLGAMMGVSFLDNSGGTALTISAAPSAIVWPLSASSKSLPLGNGGTNPLTTTAFSGAATLASCLPTAAVTAGSASSLTATQTSGYSCSGTAASGSAVSSVVSPSWSPVAGAAGAVTTAGDLAIVDATSATNYVTVNVYLTNLAALLVDYSSFALPVNVYQTTCTTTSCSSWTPAAAVSQTNFGSYLTNTDGELTFTLPAGVGRYYDIVMEGTNHYTNGSSVVSPSWAPPTSPGTTTTGLGGAFAVTQTNGANGSLSPTFFFSANAS